MTTEDMIRALGNVIEEYKNKPVFTGQTDIPMMCRDVIGKLKELSNPWHTGTPTYRGRYLVSNGYDTSISYFDGKEFIKDFLGFPDVGDIVKWQKIEEGEEVNG